MANGLSHYERWRRLLDDGQDHRVLELVIDELDRFEALGQERYDKMVRRVTFVMSALVGIMGTLIAIAIRI